VMALLASPYPHNGSVVVVNQTAQLIDGAGRPVPLSEVSGLLCCDCNTSARLLQHFLLQHSTDRLRRLQHSQTAALGAQTEQRVGKHVSAVLMLLRAFRRVAQSLSARAAPGVRAPLR